MSEKIGTIIKRMRVDKKLSSKEFAEKAGLSLAAISYIENNQVKPSLISLKKISEALECDFDTLYELYQQQ